MGNKAGKGPSSFPQEIIVESIPSAPTLPSAEMEKPWRKTQWVENSAILTDLDGLQPSLEVLRILVIGQVGAGKSCFINTVQRSLLDRNFHGALEDSTAAKSFTRSLKTHQMKKREGGHYPFKLIDIMGLEPANGIQPEDIIKTLEGNIFDGYTFNEARGIQTDDPKYNKSPGLCDRVHCVVNILAADSISRMDDGIYSKFKQIREKASRLGIPQVIILTKVDKACQVVEQDLTKIYHSKKIEQKVKACSNDVGIPTNSIYPVENYHSQITQDVNVDNLILMALRDIVNFANDYAEMLKSTEE